MPFQSIRTKKICYMNINSVFQKPYKVCAKVYRYQNKYNSFAFQSQKLVKTT